MADKSLMELLRESEERLPQQGRVQIRASMAPILERLREPWDQEELDPVVNAVFGMCRRLYGVACSGDALTLAQAVHAQPGVGANRPLLRRVTTMCGLLAGDTADLVSAIEYHVQALRLATLDDDPLEMSGVWNNIGLATGISGNYDMAVRCYDRALALVRDDSQPIYSRYAACLNLADSLFQLGNVDDGVRYGEMALLEMTPDFRERDLYAAILLRRNLVRLLVAARRGAEAECHVAEAVALAQRTQSPRARIAAATTQAAYEIAMGRSDVALTRLDQALARAREVPAALRDTLACVIRAEEAAGDPARALMRLDELSRHVYAYSIERARDYVEIAAVADSIGRAAEQRREQAKARLIARLSPPSEPQGWKALQRLAVSAAMRMEVTGWHGMRVGALSKALALESGLPPIQALEIGLAAELHDIGMMSVPQGILLKKGPLNEAEQAIVRRHTAAGEELLRDDSHPRMLLAREIAKYHHAHWDGNGSPERVGGTFIPLGARICAIADAYDMMVFGYGSTPPRSMSEALQELQRQAGRQFDPALVSCFDELIRREVEDRGMDLSAGSGMEDFQELILSLKENRGFV